MPISPETIHAHLVELPQRRSLDAVLELLNTLGYGYADELRRTVRACVQKSTAIRPVMSAIE